MNQVFYREPLNTNSIKFEVKEKIIFLFFYNSNL